MNLGSGTDKLKMADRTPNLKSLRVKAIDFLLGRRNLLAEIIHKL
jgi:hypothetical protein